MKERRCRAYSKRSKQRCKNWALRGKGVCRFHGGNSTGPKSSEGKERVSRAHFKHGLCSSSFRSKLLSMRNFIKISDRLLKNFTYN